MLSRLVVALMLFGCGEESFEDPYCGNGFPDPSEERDQPGTSYCDTECNLIPIAMPVRWSFDAGMNVVATSSAIDVDVVGGQIMKNVTTVFSP